MKKRMNAWMMRISVFFFLVLFVLLCFMISVTKRIKRIHLSGSFFTHKVGIELDDYCLRDGRNVTIPYGDTSG